MTQVGICAGKLIKTWEHEWESTWGGWSTPGLGLYANYKNMNGGLPLTLNAFGSGVLWVLTCTPPGRHVLRPFKC